MAEIWLDFLNAFDVDNLALTKGAFVVPYGTMSAVEFDLTDVTDKIVVDDSGQCEPGRPFGALRRHAGKSKETRDRAEAALRMREDFTEHQRR